MYTVHVKASRTGACPRASAVTLPARTRCRMSTQSRTPAPSAAGRSTSVPATSTATRGGASQKAGNAAVARREEGGVAGTLRGWWNGAAEWVGDRYDDASTAVGDAYRTTQRVAGDVADVVRSTSVGYKDGTLTASTDADEVMDLLPASLRGGVELDKKNPQANRVDLSLDTKSGRLTVAVPDLQVKSISGQGVRAGPTQLRGVVVTVDGADRKARDVVKKAAGETVTGWVFGKDEPKAAPARTQVRVASATATDVQAGGTSARQIELGGIDLSLEEGAQGGTGAFFTVGSAAVSGLQAQGASAAQVTAAGVSGSLGGDRESGAIAAERLAARDLQTAGAALQSGEARDVRASFSNRGGGLPVVDAKADRDLRVDGSAGSVRASGAQASGTSVRSASASGARVRAGGGALAVDLDALDVESLDSANLDARRAQAERVNVTRENGASRTSVGRLDASGVDAGGRTAGRVQAEALAVGTSATETQVSADRARVADGTANGVRVAEADVSGLSVANGKDGARVRAGSAAVSGVSGAQVEVASASARNLAVSTGGRTEVSADAAEASGVRAGTARVGAADVTGLRALVDGAALEARAERASVAGVDTQAVDVARANATNLHVTRGAEGARLSAKDAQVEGLDTATVDAARASARNLALHGSARSGSLSASELEATGLRGPTMTANLAQASGVSASAGTDANGALRTEGVVERLAVQGLDTSTVDARSAEVRGAGWSVGGDLASARVEGASVEGGSLGAARAEQVRVGRAEASFDGRAETGTMRVSDGSVQGLVTPVARVGSASAQNLQASATNRGGGLPALDARPDDLRLQANVQRVDASGIDGSRVDAASFAASGLSLDTRGAAPVVGVQEGRATGVAVRHDGSGVRMREAEIVDGQARLGSGIDMSADRLRAGGVTFDAAYPSGQKRTDGASRGAGQGIDLLPLAAAVDEASVQGSVPLRAADHGAVAVRPDTRADLRARVSGGRVDPAATGVTLSRSADGPLWTEVNGVYLDPDKSGERAALRADVSGWKDPNVTTSLPGSPETLPLDVPSLVRQVAPSTVGASGTRAAGASGGSGGIGSVVDLSRASVTGAAHVRNGPVDLGAAEATIAGERATDNRVNFEADGAGRIALLFSRLLMSNLKVDAGGQQIEAGGVASTDARMQVRQASSGQQVDGSIGAVELRDVQSRPAKQ
jgi:hypothetical protein